MGVNGPLQTLMHYIDVGQNMAQSWPVDHLYVASKKNITPPQKINKRRCNVDQLGGE